MTEAAIVAALMEQYQKLQKNDASKE